MRRGLSAKLQSSSWLRAAASRRPPVPGSMVVRARKPRSVYVYGRLRAPLASHHLFHEPSGEDSRSLPQVLAAETSTLTWPRSLCIVPGMPCCNRSIGFEPILFPPEFDLLPPDRVHFWQLVLKMGIYTGLVRKAGGKEVNLRQGVLELDLNDGLEPTFEYSFQLQVELKFFEHLPIEEDIIGDWQIRTTLICRVTNEPVIEKVYKWDGPFKRCFPPDWKSNNWFWTAPPGEGDRPYLFVDFVADMYEKSLDQIIYDFERRPEKATVHPKKEQVILGEEISIDVDDILDGMARQSKKVWRVVLKAEQGQIIDGEIVGDDSTMRAFVIGESGRLTARYRAPEKCPQKRMERIIAYNTCEMWIQKPPIPGCDCPEALSVDWNRSGIGYHDIEILCPKYRIECQHEVEYAGFGYVWTKITGQVDIFVRRDGERVLIEGKGEISITQTLHMGLSVDAVYAKIRAEVKPTGAGSGTTNVTVSGEIVDTPDGKLMQVTWDEDCYATWTGTMSASASIGGIAVEKTEPWVMQKNHITYNRTLKLEEGAVSVEPLSKHLRGGQGEYRWILHLLEPA